MDPVYVPPNVRLLPSVDPYVIGAVLTVDEYPAAGVYADV